MLLGLKAKTRDGPSFQVEYLILIKEIKPWPPSHSLRTPRAVLIEWEHGDEHSGSTKQVVPLPGTGSGIGDGRIEFNESFRLPVTLLRETSFKGGDGDTYQKNCVEFHLYEPRCDKTVKGQLLGTAIIDLADYGVIRESLSICPPINCKRTYRNTAQPLLFLKIQLVDRSRTRSSLWDSLKREASMDRNGSLSRLLSEEYAEEAEFASYTDDDVSSLLSMPVSSSANRSNYGSPPQGEDSSEGVKSSHGQDEVENVLTYNKRFANMDGKPDTKSLPRLTESSSHSTTDLSSDLAWISRKIGGCSSIQHSTSTVSDITGDSQSPCMLIKQDKQVLCGEQTAANGESSDEISTRQRSEEDWLNGLPAEKSCLVPHITDESSNFVNTTSNFSNSEIEENTSTPSVNGLSDDAKAAVTQNGSIEGENSEDHNEDGLGWGPHNGEKHQQNGQVKEIVEDEGKCIKDVSISCYSEEDTIKNDLKDINETSAYRDSSGAKISTSNNETLKHVMSVRSSPESNRVNGSMGSNQPVVQDPQKGARGFPIYERNDQKGHPRDTTNILLERKIHNLEERVEMLEGELREAAAIEVSLYSVIAEHGCSPNKVYAPARRLSRFYIHACKENSVLKKGSAAKSAISGIYLVAKACGNDVARLTFWLSNSVVLRASITKFYGQQKLPLSTGTVLGNAVVKDKKKFSPLKWECCYSNGGRVDVCESLGNWEDPVTFVRALESTEAWIFSRIIESIWWQTLIPHMQSDAAKAICNSMGSKVNNVCSRTSSSGAEERGKFSLYHWKKAFKDAYERVCPVRAGGHECGCLHFLSKLIMEQCVARLDVAMFNAILRESADGMPSDPLSDPISDAEVLPIMAGKASFGAGAQLKNAIGNWSRWLTDLVGISDGNSLDYENIADNEDNGSEEYDGSSKSFYLLDALSDLMMLPKDMLLSRTIRKEVCPTFGPIIIRRILNVFVPDEFCPDPIPEVVLEALNSEDPFDADEDSVMSYPCTAAPIAYKPPSTASVAGLLGDISNHSQLRRSGSSVLKKSYTSDDELDQLDLDFIISEGIEASPPLAKPSSILKGSGNLNAVRYQLLREAWINSE